MSCFNLHKRFIFSKIKYIFFWLLHFEAACFKGRVLIFKSVTLAAPELGNIQTCICMYCLEKVWAFFLPNTAEKLIHFSFPRQTMYAVVTLQDSNELMVAASNWLTLDKTQCNWPSFRSPEKYTEAVKNRLPPLTKGIPWDVLKIHCHEECGNSYLSNILLTLHYF